MANNVWRQRQLGGSDNEMSTVKRRQRSTFLSFVYLLKGFLGMGSYTIPYTVHYGTAAVFINMIVFAICVYLLVNVCQKLGGGLSYPETAKAACLTYPRTQKFATPCSIIVHIFLFCSTIFLCSLYIVFITHNMHAVVSAFQGHFVNYRLWLLKLSVPLLVLCLLPCLTLMAVIGVLCQLATIILFYGYIVPSDMPSKGGINVDTFTQDILHYTMCGLITSFLEGISIVLVVENEMKHPNKMLDCPSLVGMVMTIDIILNSTFALLALYKYGSLIRPFVILITSPKTKLGSASHILAALSIYFTYPIQFNVGFMVVWTHIEPKINKKAQKPVECVLRIILVVITMGLALINPDCYVLHIILHGTVFLVFLGVIMPIFLQICVSCGGEESKARIICFSIFLVIYSLFMITHIVLTLYAYTDPKIRKYVSE